MDQFTCICCRVAFKDSEIQRLHYKTDWHRYNLKRKVADLPPVSSEEFQRRVISQKSQDAELTQDTSKYCKACRKAFTNEKAFDNHLNSKKHKENLVHFVEDLDEVVPEGIVPEKMEVASVPSAIDSDVEEVDSDEWDEDIEIDVSNCMFCEHHSKNMLKNLQHMSLAHTFFVPDVEYCTDIAGLLVYLGQKIGEGFMCLWCNEKGRTFHGADAVRSHMLDKGHCKMIHEGKALAEYTDFYDYSASYPDAQDDALDINEAVDIPELDGNEYQLVLPSGATVGHRSLFRYYKQSLDPNRTNAIIAQRNSKKLHKVLSTYRALGWSPAQQESYARTARDIHYLKRMQSKHNMRLAVKANKFQTHYRPQVLF